MNDAMARYDELGKFSLAKQLEVLVNPRWEALKDRGNDALKAGEWSVALTWYKRAESLTDVQNALTAFFRVISGLGGAAARLASAEKDLRGVIFSFMPDEPRAIVPFDSEALQRNAAHGWREPEEGPEPSPPKRPQPFTGVHGLPLTFHTFPSGSEPNTRRPCSKVGSLRMRSRRLCPPSQSVPSTSKATTASPPA